jgi:hypothetical protein
VPDTSKSADGEIFLIFFVFADKFLSRHFRAVNLQKVDSSLALKQILPFLLETQKRLFNFVIVKRGRKKPALG